MNSSYLHLGIAIVCETVATTALKSSESFTRFWPSVLTITGYVLAFYFLSLTLRTIPTGIAYALWSGFGIILICAMGWFFHGQTLDLAAMLGIGLIVAGVIVLNVFSRSLGA
jgi:small multidrug resistance pump